MFVSGRTYDVYGKNRSRTSVEFCSPLNYTQNTQNSAREGWRIKKHSSMSDQNINISRRLRMAPEHYLELERYGKKRTAWVAGGRQRVFFLVLFERKSGKLRRKSSDRYKLYMRVHYFVLLICITARRSGQGARAGRHCCSAAAGVWGFCFTPIPLRLG